MKKKLLQQWKQLISEAEMCISPKILLTAKTQCYTENVKTSKI